jgi:hypothetical protein
LSRTSIDRKPKTFAIPYGDFYSTKSRSFNADDITAVVFSFNGTNLCSESFEIQVSNVQFISDIKISMMKKHSSVEVNVFPNPCTEVINVVFEMNELLKIPEH